ncbi:MAG: DNA mismatch endonuclease Vsr [Mesorhizobium sp.]|nr:MAG: DNA mismatch endonuclease Vsr [Mesorhizobium sp.]RWQ57713.1 MAG: DNA mismatch endonuclease Vsr [Mesorhizobium sp.]
MDRLSPSHRSWLMSRVRGKDTTPELIVRRVLHRLGYRFRLHDPKMRGKPDLVLASRRKIIFVHGCFWHRHAGCKKATLPKSNQVFWQEKFEKNVARDEKIRFDLEAQGWSVLVVWQCETKDPETLERLLGTFLEAPVRAKEKISKRSQI